MKNNKKLKVIIAIVIILIIIIGVVLGIVQENRIPVKFIGIGEQIDDMEIFNSEEFVKAII